MAVKGPHLAAGVGVPEPDGPVPARRGDLLAVGADGHGKVEAGVPAEDNLRLAGTLPDGLGRPDPHRLEARRSEPLAIRAERHPVDRPRPVREGRRSASAAAEHIPDLDVAHPGRVIPVLAISDGRVTAVATERHAEGPQASLGLAGQRPRPVRMSQSVRSALRSAPARIPTEASRSPPGLNARPRMSVGRPRRANRSSPVAASRSTSSPRPVSLNSRRRRRCGPRG